MYCKTYLQFSSQIKRQMAEKLNFKKSMWLMCGSIGNGGGGGQNSNLLKFTV